MLNRYFSRLAGTGLGHPLRVLTNNDLSNMVETSDEWIFTRTGIRERKLIDPKQGQSNSSICAEAIQEALKRAGRSPKELDHVIVCTTTPDTWMPITAARVAHAIGAPKVGCVDLNAACSGFLSGAHFADGLIRGGNAKLVAVAGADIFSSLLDWKDRSTCVLFGDGAGAAVFERAENVDPSKDSCVLGSVIHAELDVDENLAVLGGGSKFPYESGEPYYRNGKPFLQMKGQDVFKMASRCMAEVAQEVLQKCGYSTKDLRWFVPHQANRRIVEMVARLLEVPMDKVFMNMDRWGNTSAATVAICLAEMNRQGLLNKGDLVLLDVFGGGYTYGAMLLRW